MANWLFTFRPETYEQVKAHGVIGVRLRHSPRFERLAVGDGVVAYVTRVQRLEAIGHVVGKPYREASDEPPGWRAYELRCKIVLDQVDIGAAGRHALLGLSICGPSLRTEPANYINCLGGFLELDESDWTWMLAQAQGHAAIAEANRA